MKIAAITTTSAKQLGDTPWLVGAAAGHAFVRGLKPAARSGVADGVIAPTDEGLVATDGVRLAFISPTGLVLHASLDDASPQTFAFDRPLENGKAVELLSAALVGDAIWAVFSDTFAVAQGRFIARLEWAHDTASWGPLKSPYSWAPHSHSGVRIESVGAATAETAFMTAYSEGGAVLARVGKNPHKGVAIERGIFAFGTAPPSLLVFANRKFQFYDAEGKARAAFGFSGALKEAIGTPSAISQIKIAGREIWISTWKGPLVRVLLGEDPPSLLVPGGRAKKPAPFVETRGLYGPLDPARSKTPLVIAIERVQAWDLNEVPAFGKPARYSALIVTPEVVQFCRERDGRLRKGFDFLASAVTVTTVAAPKGTPKGIVLARLRTPSGLTQILCRREFAATLAASTKQPG
ncbi:MAG TPA: hypothetical protein VGC41_23220 [Kofleriaceae bacterium]